MTQMQKKSKLYSQLKIFILMNTLEHFESFIGNRIRRGWLCFLFRFLLSLRDDCVSAVEHIAFRAKHSLMPQVIMLTHSVKKAIERSVLKQDETILSSPEVSFQDRVKAVTSDSLRITARRESIRLESANYYNSTLLSNGNTGGATATSSTGQC